ncbi:MAG TPA: iron-containing redox enzyme family protein [candidate division Zixibacteria bacterium]|nr:iron-containing redox enzyme family protein [candidate division Zixibacteria bacterium]
MADLDRLKSELDHMANAQFESPEFRRLFSVRLTPERARFYIIHNALYTKNRRDCWGFVLGAAPLDVKKLIWKHEEDELISDRREGLDHYTLVVRQAASVGVSAEEIERAEPIPGARAAHYAWLFLAKDRPWLQAFTSSTMLERRNNGRIVKGGGLSARIARKWVEELGIPLEEAPSSKVHSVADVEHSDMMWGVFEKHARTDEAQREVLAAARECMEIDRAYRGALAAAMEAIG